MKIIQSLDTTLIRDTLLNSTMLNKEDNFLIILRMAVLSHLKLIEYYPEKQIEFYVDDFLYKLLKDIFPNTIFKLTDITPLNKTHIWTQSKLSTIRSIKDPFLHIDCDIIFNKKINLDLAKNYNVFVERIEDKYTFEWYKKGILYIEEMKNYFNNNAFKEINMTNLYWNIYTEFAYNCGIIGFNDIKEKQLYVDFYDELENLYTNGLHLKPYYEQIFVVLEQYSLSCFTDKQNLSVGTLLPGNDLLTQSEYAKKIGYVHLFGNGKFLSSNILKIIEILSTKYKSVYDKLLNIEKDYIKFKNDNT